ncbi:helix-turn-helix domain-containing protein [Georgenia sp. SUBG003]|uniref:helix-turn-helix domain-containing protein n=1 Tax=Georgenia sp. SUBG003 TaxID=1497974 RepID=UPI003AB8E2BC
MPVHDAVAGAGLDEATRVRVVRRRRPPPSATPCGRGSSSTARSSSAPPALDRPARRTLSAREVEVLRLVATGATNRAIAGELYISERTVDRHVSSILTKLGVTSRAAATARAAEWHLV